MDALIILGIVVTVIVYFVMNIEMTLACSDDGTPMHKTGENEYECPKCGLVKLV